MSGHFWTNTVWYVLLALVTAAEAAAAVAKAENRRFLVVYMMATAGLFYLFEYFLVALLGAYAYRPVIFAQDAFADSYAGNVFSQTSIAASCGVIIAYRLKWYWYPVIAAAYFLVELLFTRLGVFEEHWYKAVYTPLIMIPLFALINKGYQLALLKKIDERFLLFFGAMSVTGVTVTMPMKLLGLYRYVGGLFANPSKDHTVTGTIFGVILVSLVIMAYRKKGWVWKAAIAALLFAMNWAAWRAGLILFREGWFPWVTAIEILAFYAWVSLIGWMAESGPQRSGFRGL